MDLVLIRLHYQYVQGCGDNTQTFVVLSGLFVHAPWYTSDCCTERGKLFQFVFTMVLIVT